MLVITFPDPSFNTVEVVDVVEDNDEAGEDPKLDEVDLAVVAILDSVILFAALDVLDVLELVVDEDFDDDDDDDFDDDEDEDEDVGCIHVSALVLALPPLLAVSIASTNLDALEAADDDDDDFDDDEDEDEDPEDPEELEDPEDPEELEELEGTKPPK